MHFLRKRENKGQADYYFTDSGIIGTKEFLSRVCQEFKGYFTSRHENRPKPVHGLDSVYSLKRLSEGIA